MKWLTEEQWFDTYYSPDGGVDLHAKNENYEILLHISTDESDQIKFYGDNYGERTIEGEFKIT